jgi:segregation and condensation protein B
MSLKARVEAVLFLTDKPLAAAAIAQLVNVDVQDVRQSILELIHDYEERNSALEIADDGGYMMQVKDEYATFANDLAPIDLPVSIVRTLSAIAIKQPVLQSEIVRIRGAGAYDHIKELLEKELITKKEEGRSALLSTTKKFQEYFRLSQDAKALRDRLKEQDKTQPQEVAAAESTEAQMVQAGSQQLSAGAAEIDVEPFTATAVESAPENSIENSDAVVEISSSDSEELTISEAKSESPAPITSEMTESSDGLEFASSNLI